MYYANEFIYYYVREGEKFYHNYTGIRLYKSQEEALNNAEGEWWDISNDMDILTQIRTKTMYIYNEEIWNDNENNTSNEEK